MPARGFTPSHAWDSSTQPPEKKLEEKSENFESKCSKCISSVFCRGWEITVLNFGAGFGRLSHIDRPLVLAALVATLDRALVDHLLAEHLGLVTVVELGAVRLLLATVWKCKKMNSDVDLGWFPPPFAALLELFSKTVKSSPQLPHVFLQYIRTPRYSSLLQYDSMALQYVIVSAQVLSSLSALPRVGLFSAAAANG